MNANLFAAMDMPAPQLLPVAGGMACVFSERRPGRYTPNEDAAVVIPAGADSGLLAVADGLGGLPAGDQASGTVLQLLIEHSGGEGGEDLRTTVLSALEQANETIQTRGQGGATTVVVAMLEDHYLRSAIVGDSMLVVCGQRGKLKYRSVPHSPVGYAEAAGMLDESEAMFHDQRHLVSNVIGTGEMHVELGPPLRLAARDTVILGSDGLFDNLYVDEVIQLVRSGPLQQAGDRLLDACRQRMQGGAGPGPHKPDDLTYILYRRTT